MSEREFSHNSETASIRSPSPSTACRLDVSGARSGQSARDPRCRREPVRLSRDLAGYSIQSVLFRTRRCHRKNRSVLAACVRSPFRHRSRLPLRVPTAVRTHPIDWGVEQVLLNVTAGFHNPAIDTSARIDTQSATSQQSTHPMFTPKPRK